MAPSIAPPAPPASTFDLSEASSSPNNIPLGQYLFLRIAQANPKLRTVFGIPGDFNLNLLEHLYSKPVAEDAGLRIANLCNELNAAYTADGYARAIDGLAVLITTFGVGELSACNGVAGSFTEYSPVLHIVGTTSTRQQSLQDDQPIINHHHLLQNKDPLKQPDHDVYRKMADHICVVNEKLAISDVNSGDIYGKIDKVLRTILQQRRPGYLFVPSDIPDMMVDARMLDRPFIVDDEPAMPVMDDVVSVILRKLYAAKSPAVLSDALTARFGHTATVQAFVDKLPANLRLFSTNLARNIDETKDNFVGCYYGVGSPSPQINWELEHNTDFLLHLGIFNAETNTAGYSMDFSNIQDKVIIHPDYLVLDGWTHSLIKGGRRLFTMGQLLARLAERVETNKFTGIETKEWYKHNPQKLHKPDAETDNQYVSQSKLVDAVTECLSPNDILVVETCSFQFAMPDVKLPTGVKYITQAVWGSIGYALPATLGVTFAVNDMGLTDRRIWLLEGDGSAQMTVQELSTYLRYHDILKVNPTIFVINNSGYTVERLINGPTRSYNDIQSTWQWSKLLQVFGDVDKKYHHSSKVNNVAEFDQWFANEEYDGKLNVVDVTAGKMDVSDRFLSLFLKK
ncbi:hypothetical protein DIURU_005608 [Diutina rugosa]|uniref:Pyruvate decarboxylase n=1 Tax=Diutina rugosa TaxID=5481 RepID=A0A642UC50_DIURU|nr:uncharacterized protein DIURU_005608 [Diutina rugosa]KAA8896596.1 hypothetical protein DIURU_005608 [Diutina rugosa]